jgi:putative two-component system response regulator
MAEGAVAVAEESLARCFQAAGESLEGIICLAAVAEFRDTGVAPHLRRISRISALIAAGLGLATDQVERIRLASPMHDLGKVAVPSSILLKPAALTPQERKIVETHTLVGAELLANWSDPLAATAREIALSHHERWDGGGYPQCLRGDRIPLPARIVCLADVLDALATQRCYKPAYGLDTVREILKKENGSHFDPDCHAALASCMDEVVGVYAGACAGSALGIA